MRQLIVATLVLASATAAMGADSAVLDQFCAPPENMQVSVRYPAYVAVAQTFTVGQRGALSEVDVDLSNFYYAKSGTFEVLGTTNGMPASDQVLAIGDIPPQSHPLDQWFPLAVSSHASPGTPLWVAPGQVLAIALFPVKSSPQEFDWWGGQHSSDLYPGGSVFVQRSLGGPWQSNEIAGSYRDMAFRTYEVVPEPSTAGMAILAAAMFLRRRRA